MKDIDSKMSICAMKVLIATKCDLDQKISREEIQVSFMEILTQGIL